MTLLPAGELADMRDVLEQTYPDALVIYHRTKDFDTSGGFDEVWTPDTPTVGRIAPLGGGMGGAMSEQEIAGRVGTAEAWILTVAVDTDISETDRVLLAGDRGLEVATVLAPRSWEISRRVVLVELN